MEVNKEDIERMVKEEILNIHSHSDAAEVCEILSECLHNAFGKEQDKQEHLYKYAIAALCSYTNHLIRCRQRLDADDIATIVTTAFGLGRLRENHIGLLEGMKKKCILKWGIMPKEDLLAGAKGMDEIRDLETMLEDLLGGGGIKVIRLSDLLSGRRSKSDPRD